MPRRFLGVGASGLGVLIAILVTALAPRPGQAVEALVLCGNDNTLSSVDLVSGDFTLGLFPFGGFPNQAVISQGLLYVVASGSDEVYVLGASSLAPLDTLLTGTGTNPYSVAVDEGGNVFVSLFLTRELVVFDATGLESARVPVGVSPEGVLLHEGKVFVTNTGFRFSDFGYDPGTVSVLSAASLDSLDTIPVGINPQWVQESGNELHVLCTGDYASVFGEVHIVDAVTHAPLDTISLGGSPGFLELTDNLGFASDYFGGLYSYDLATGQVIHGALNPISFGGTGYSGMEVEDEDRLLVTLNGDDLLVRFRISDEAVEDAFPTGDGPVGVLLGELPIVAAREGEPFRQTLRLRPLVNPARRVLPLSLESGSSTPLCITLFDPQGRLVLEHAAPSGTRELRLPVSGLSSGVYFVRAVAGTQVAVARVVILP